MTRTYVFKRRFRWRCRRGFLKSLLSFRLCRFIIVQSVLSLSRVGGGVLLGILGRGVPPGSPNSSLCSKRFRGVLCTKKPYFWTRAKWAEREDTEEGRGERRPPLPSPSSVLFCSRPNFSRSNSEERHGNACFAGYPNSDPISDQNIPFSTPVFRPSL